MKKPFQVIRINTPKPTGSRNELLTKFANSKDASERTQLLQNALYPNILKSTEEEK
jgi:hypothetical protein